MQLFRTRRGGPSIVAATTALTLAACGGSTATTSPSGGSAGTKIPGGTAYLAEAPSAQPNWIFPMMGLANFSTYNIGQFQGLMYRPLYWYGKGGKPVINYKFSIGQKPVFSQNDTVATVHLNHYIWSDGQPVTSRDVVFWMNLLKANKANWAAYVAGAFPDNVVSVSAPNSSTVVFHLNKSYNPTWFTYNELSQVTPLPIAWDRTSLSQPVPSPTAANLPDTTPSGAVAVYNFLTAQSKQLSTYVTSPLWSVVDGPWKLSSFSADGHITFVPNGSYTGPSKPTLSKFVELPFTSSSAEFALLRSGPDKASVATLPNHDVAQAPVLKSLGYKIDSKATMFAINFFAVNFHNPTFGPVYKQLYFRQAFQHLIDQPGWAHAFYHGGAVPTYGPVPVAPANSFADSFEKANPYPFSVSSAKKLLSSHGWKVVPGGTTTCQRPGTAANECGAGIPKGKALSFNLDYATGTTAITNSMENLKTTAAQVGIQLQLTEHPFNSVIARAVPCAASTPTCSWTMENWGAGWVYAPDYYPTGGELYGTGAGSNSGSYSSPTADRLIALTHTASASQSQAALNKYQDYIAKQLPVFYTPSSVGAPESGGPVVTAGNLRGFTPNPYAFINPEEWYFVK
ncbi:MAG: ABC transporter substrate-binding protein [Actinomycetota bacterium]|nr:ABC transporter substrate-binding protein [Actinomycetota bacterium]